MGAKRWFLQTREVRESHTGENIAEKFEMATEDWGLSGRLSAVTTDNAHNIVQHTQHLVMHTLE